MKSLSIIVPAFNEVDNIGPTLAEILAATPVLAGPFEIIVVDDASTDGTAAVVERIMAATTGVRLLRNTHNLGFGGAFQRGLSEARMDACMMVPGDNAVDRDSLRTVLAAVEKADIVVPYVTNLDVRDPFRRALSRLFVRLMNAICGLRLRYYNGFNVVPTQAVREMEVTAGFAFSAQILARLLLGGHSYAEVPVRVTERISGRSKAITARNAFSVAGALLRIFVDARLSTRGPRRPSAT